MNNPEEKHLPEVLQREEARIAKKKEIIRAMREAEDRGDVAEARRIKNAGFSWLYGMSPLELYNQRIRERKYGPTP